METDMNTKQGRFDFVMGVWLALAPYAYGAYLEHGRGAVVIPTAPEGPGDPKWLTVAPKSAPELARMIAEYDPEDEIIVIFEFFDGTQRIAFGTYGIDDYPPPQAHADLLKAHGGV